MVNKNINHTYHKNLRHLRSMRRVCSYKVAQQQYRTLITLMDMINTDKINDI